MDEMWVSNEMVRTFGITDLIKRDVLHWNDKLLKLNVVKCKQCITLKWYVLENKCGVN